MKKIVLILAVAVLGFGENIQNSEEKGGKSSLKMMINETELEMVLKGEKDGIYDEELDIYKALCGKEDAVACVKLARFYQKDATKNEQESAKFLKRACILGDQNSCEAIVNKAK